MTERQAGPSEHLATLIDQFYKEWQPPPPPKGRTWFISWSRDFALWLLEHGVTTDRPRLEAARGFCDLIETIENRCLAADGPVTPTLREATEEELRTLYQHCKAVAAEK